MLKIKNEIKKRIKLIFKGKVPEGYKKTKIGIIPEDWKVKSFDKLFEFSGGYAVPRNKLGEHGICYLHYGDIHTNKSNFINVNKEWSLIPKINKDIDTIKDTLFLNDGDIVFADASEDYEGIGKAITILNKSNIPFIAGLHTIVAKDKTNLVYRDYKKHFLLNHNIKKQFMFYATGISVLGINRENIKKIIAPLPPISEQQKIAQILSTWDEAIELKEKLIKEKKQQKKGLMQNLLTGKVRLPGFEGEWEIKELKNICTLETGKRPRGGVSETGDVPSLGGENINNDNGLNLNTVKKISNDFFNSMKQGILKENDILINKDGANTGKVALYKNAGFKKASVNEHLFIIRPKNNIYYKFLYYYLASSKAKNKIKSRITSSAQPGLNSKFVNGFHLLIPSYEEQTKIGNILYSSDIEIKLLEKEVEFFKLQKKGLMQLLLTGIVRVEC